MRPATLLRNATFMIVASALSAGAFAQTANVAVSPGSPTTDDVVVLSLSGQWPDSCTPGTALAPVVTRTGTRIGVVFRAAGTFSACGAQATAWNVRVPLGKLPAASFQVDVALDRMLQPSLALGSASFAVTPPQLVHLFVPSFLAPGEVTLASRLTAFNNGGGTASIGLLAAYDAYGRHELGGGGTALEPGAAVKVDTENVSAGSVRFVEVVATTHVALRASLERLVGGASEGRLALPVFDAPFPAGSSAVAGDVRLGGGFRRANLTLFNASGETATVQVAVTTETGLPLSTRTVSLAPESTQQVNNLITAADVVVGGSTTAYIRITADQPFLAYASATYDAAAPGAIPYEIFPAH